MTSIRQSGWAWILWTGTFVALGCGGADHPPLGYVTGTVTLNREPLVGVIVLFKPENGRAAVGVTDSQGVYNLEYVQGVRGTKVGPNAVNFEWPLGFAGAKPLPEKYTLKSTEKREVKAGKNTLNFDLESGGVAARKPVQNVD